MSSISLYATGYKGDTILYICLDWPGAAAAVKCASKLSNRAKSNQSNGHLIKMEFAIIAYI